MTDVLGAPNAPASYQPIPYRVDADEAVTCPHCQLMNDSDASYCDQCGTELAGATVTVDGASVDDFSPEPYDAEDDETVQCPVCQHMNDPDARFCDQCGTPLVGRPDVQIVGDVNDPDEADDEASEEGRSLPPREPLIRARQGAGVNLRAADDGNGSVMFGHFSTFGTWYEVDSYWEGTFMESVSSSAFDRTMVDDRSSMKVLYDHGFDPTLGNKPLGPIQTLRADDVGAYYEVPLLDTDYNRDFVLPALKGLLMNGESVGSQLGASFRFIVLDEMWEQKPDPSDVNPQGLPQRTITRAQVLEFGPVTFPASPTASSGVRSLTDSFMEHLRSDAKFAARFTERAGLKTVERIFSMEARGASGASDQAGRGEGARVGHSTHDHQSFRLRARLAVGS